MATTNGKVTVDAVADRAATVPPAAKVGTFARLVRMADRLSEGKGKTVLTRKTLDGSLSVTVAGKMCLSDAEAVAWAGVNGATMSAKAESGFGAASGAVTAPLASKVAGGFVAELCRPDDAE